MRGIFKCKAYKRNFESYFFLKCNVMNVDFKGYTVHDCILYGASKN